MKNKGEWKTHLSKEELWEQGSVIDRIKLITSESEFRKHHFLIPLISFLALFSFLGILERNGKFLQMVFAGLCTGLGISALFILFPSLNPKLTKEEIVKRKENIKAALIGLPILLLILISVGSLIALLCTSPVIGLLVIIILILFFK